MCVHKSVNRKLVVKKLNSLFDLKALLIFEALCYNIHQKWKITDYFELQRTELKLVSKISQLYLQKPN